MSENEAENKDGSIVPSNEDKKHQMLPPGFEDLRKRHPRSDCTLCQSKYREEAHELYNRTGSLKRVHRFLVDDRQENISYPSVRNHLKFHYDSVNDRSLIQEYTKEVEGWLALQDDQLFALKRTMSMIDREMNTIASQNEGLPLAERRKNSDTLAKLGGLLLQYRAKITELEGEKSPIETVLQNVVKHLYVIIKEELDNSDSEEVRQVVSNILTKFKKSMKANELLKGN